MVNTFYFYWGINRQSREIGFKRIGWREESHKKWSGSFCEIEQESGGE
jgi:hypothetical protein